MTVTRELIADLVAEAFAAPPASRSELLDAAAVGGAGDDVLRALERLPEGSYRQLRDLWQHLPEIPVHA